MGCCGSNEVREERRRQQQILNDTNPAKFTCRTMAGSVLCELEFSTEALGGELAQAVMDRLDKQQNCSLQLLLGDQRLEEHERLRDQSVEPGDALELLVLVQEMPFYFRLEKGSEEVAHLSGDDPKAVQFRSSGVVLFSDELTKPATVRLQLNRGYMARGWASFGLCKTSVDRAFSGDPGVIPNQWSMWTSGNYYHEHRRVSRPSRPWPDGSVVDLHYTPEEGIITWRLNGKTMPQLSGLPRKGVCFCVESCISDVVWQLLEPSDPSDSF